MIFIKNFNELGKGDAAIAGGKGASLGEMTVAGVPVPPGFVLLSSAFEHFLDETNLNVEIDAILTTVNTEEMRSVEHASERIQKLILEAKMPDDIAREIEKFFTTLDAQWVAVRSSATAEDSDSAAWAGQLDTYLNTTKKSLLKNVQRCWASLFTSRAIFYRFEKGLHASKISVAVVVQKMIQSEVSGIVFTVHPVTEDPDQMIVEAGLGLGEAIVSGQITPDSYVVDKTNFSILDINVSEQSMMIIRGGKDNIHKKLTVEMGGKQKLTGRQIVELAKICKTIEQHYGKPQDIEWALAGGKFYITQSRPITTLTSNQPIISQEKRIWVKNFSGVQIGLQVFAVFDSGIKKSQDSLFGKNHPPIVTEFFWYMKGVDLEGAYFLKNEIDKFAKEICEAIYTDSEKIERIHEETYTFSSQFFAYTKKHLEDDLHKLSNKELGEMYANLTDLQIQAHEHAVTTTWFVDSTEQVFSQRLIQETKEFVEKAGVERNPLEVFTVLTTSPKESLALKEELEFLEILGLIQKDKASEKVFSALSAYLVMPPGISSKIARALEKHYKKWCWVPFGYMGPAYEMDHYLFDMVTLVRQGITAEKEIARKKQERKNIKSERHALFKELSIGAKMKKVYDIAADITLLKTYRKDCLYYGMYFLDKLFREMKDRLGVELMDMHYLYYTEIKDIFINGKAVNKQVIVERKESAVYYQTNNSETKIFSGRKAIEFLQNVNIEKEKLEDESGKLKGTCACSGSAKGKVKIINRPEEMGKMEQGDIMVSHTTFPSLVPAMKKAAAIVTEDGGITCHAAIVARELKVPCVTGIKIATQVLKDGDLVEVDADKGTVIVLKKVAN